MVNSRLLVDICLHKAKCLVTLLIFMSRGKSPVGYRLQALKHIFLQKTHKTTFAKVN